MPSDKITKTYDPDKVIITFGGIPIGGYADGSFAKITANSDLFTTKVGADGEIARTRKHNGTYGIDITLMQTSPSNSHLTVIENIDRATGMGIRPLSITDLSGGSLHFWPEAWISKDPDADYGAEVGDRAWHFETGQVATNLINGDYIPG